jgi:hypothetical protein
MGMREELDRVGSWRSALRRELSLLLLIKGAALALLWWFFFSPTHRTPVDAAATGRRLALEQPPGRWAAGDAAARWPGEPP